MWKGVKEKVLYGKLLDGHDVRSTYLLPIFPLPGVVLMPGAVLPLHVFEPRYRELVAYCVSHDQVFGVATLKPGYESEYHQSPPVYPSLGVGRVVSFQELPDGRSNILLQSVGCAQVVDEPPAERSFRQVSCVFQDNDYTGLEKGMRAIRGLVCRIGAVTDAAGDEARRILAMDDASLLDILARKLLSQTRDRLAYLAADQVTFRMHLVQETLADLVLHECRAAGSC